LASVSIQMASLLLSQLPEGLPTDRWLNARSGSPLSLPQHLDEHRPERPVFLAVDQEFGEGAALRVAPELADPIGAVEVGEHQHVEQLGAWVGGK
jgi:hypothetical protein